MDWYSPARPLGRRVCLSVLLWQLPLIDLPAQEPGPGLYSKVREATVEILVDGRIEGSGSFVSTNGLVITAGHVIKDGTQAIELQSASMGRLKAKLVAVDRGHDLALLSAVSSNECYACLPLAKDHAVTGDFIYIVASPLFRHRLMRQPLLMPQLKIYPLIK